MSQTIRTETDGQLARTLGTAASASYTLDKRNTNMVVTVTELKNKAEAPPASGGREPSASRDPISTEEDEKKTSRGAPTASAAAPAKVQKKGKKKDEGKKGKVETLRREVLTTQSPGLTRKQKVYESKLWPKHYKPKVMKTRMAYINENAPNKNKNTAA